MNKSKHYIATFHNDHNKFVEEAVTGKPEVIEYIADDEVYRMGDEDLYSFNDFKNCTEIKCDGVALSVLQKPVSSFHLWGRVDFSDNAWEPLEIVRNPYGGYGFLRCGILEKYPLWRLEVFGQDIVIEDHKE